MIDLDNVYCKVFMECSNSKFLMFANRKNAMKYARSFSNKYTKINDFNNELDLGSICIFFDKKSEFSYIKCNLFTLTLKCITTIENINVSHNRILTK